MLGESEASGTDSMDTPYRRAAIPYSDVARRALLSSTQLSPANLVRPSTADCEPGSTLVAGTRAGGSGWPHACGHPLARLGAPRPLYNYPVAPRRGAS
jgi:hypothetical protein